MTDSKILKILNPLLFLAMIGEMASVIVLKTAYQGWVSQWHVINGQILFALMLLHLFYNRSWIKAQFKKKSGN